ncbi:MAG: hypothetical protein H7A44_08225 [Opitutaceae bacterium]|nr:hypothetical protein [Cephaloticoccus sp.]MCP5530416.1 hypothetical protein [Opitutaceae bacterium]
MRNYLCHTSLIMALCTAPLVQATEHQVRVSPSLQHFADVRNAGLPKLAIDLTEAVIVAPAAAQGPELKAIGMLGEVIAERTLVHWPRSDTLPDGDVSSVVVGTFDEVSALLGERARTVNWRASSVKTEGYQIVTVPSADQSGSMVVIAGKDARGVLFGIGHLLRKMSLGPARAGLVEPLNIVTSPRYALRGHQLGYRPKANSYSGFTVADWERYIRDLVIFGCNTIELIPPRSDDADESPHFPQPKLETMVAMSRICDEYGIDVWIWYPAMDEDYGDPATVAFALKEWGKVFRALPRVDAMLVPGGDPGHTPPRLMFPFLKKQKANLNQYHPGATVWISPQGFDDDKMAFFVNYLQEQRPRWLDGVVFAPWVHMDISKFRGMIPAEYPLRYYPDITHTKECQYPVNDWDPAFALTSGREPICPRPHDMALLVRELQPYTIGAVTYSEGINDDVNKALYSALSWDPDRDVRDILRDYSRFYIGERMTDDFTALLLGLEQNWVGRLADNTGVDETLALFQRMERDALPKDLQNWRFQLAGYRAYFDAIVRARLLYETDLEKQANAALAKAPEIGAYPAMDEATIILARAWQKPVVRDLHLRLFQIAEALFQQIHYKSSVPLYRALSQRRGGNLDTIDYPLNNRVWLMKQFDLVRSMEHEKDRLARLDRIVNWTDPGPGGFYDDLGNTAAQPHLVPGVGHDQDPAFIHTPLNGHFPADGPPLPLRKSWVDYIWGLKDNPISLQYDGLDPGATYRIRVVYPRFPPPAKFTSPQLGKIRLMADGDIPIHDYIARPYPVKPIMYDIPRQATRDGKLTLTWNREPGLGGNGKGCDISEIWLIKADDQ